MDRAYLKRIDDYDEKLFLAHILDIIDESETKHICIYSEFLDLHKQSIVIDMLSYYKIKNYSFEAGIEDGERKLLCIINGELSPYYLPISYLKIEADSALSHRDVLGSLMGLGIKRETIGDIVKNEDVFYIAALTSIKAYIVQNLDKIGKKRVKIFDADANDIKQFEKNFSEIKDTVASLRMDCIISSACKLSRSEAARAIKSKICYVNSKETDNVCFEVKQGDVFSVRGYGKYILDEVGSLSKKGRIFIKIKKYI